MGRIVLFFLITSFACLPAAAQQSVSRHPAVNKPSPGCGDFNYSVSALGPLDYRATPADVIDFVEVRHFTNEVERLVKGEKGTVASDIAYTLGVFPNHPRALRAAAELTRRNGGTMPRDLVYSLVCWFDRALAYRPDDPQVRILWAQELIRSKQPTQALEQVQTAEMLAQGNPSIHYNVALLYFDLKQYDKSMANAKIAYEQGFNLPGLRDKLTKAGQWKP